MKIGIAEDHGLIVDGLRTLLESHGHQIFHASNYDELQVLLREEALHLLIQDIRFGAVDARTFLPQLVDEFPTMKILALTSLDDLGSIQSVLATNVNGYLCKSEPTSLILDAISTLETSQCYLSPEAEKILRGKDNGLNFVQLSSREKEVLQGVLDEKSTKEIAEQIFVSEKTVEHYRASLFLKFDVKNVSGLVKKAILLGFYR